MVNNIALQDQFLRRFFASRFSENFYLTGGTALARFYFNHRESVDLDLFTNERSIDFDAVNATLRTIVSDMHLSVVKDVVTDTFIQYITTSEDGGSLKVDVVKDIPVRFGEVGVKNGIRLDSLENIGSNKILAMFGRTDAKDFIDLYVILKKTPWEFDRLFEMAQKKDLGLIELYFAEMVTKISTITIWPEMRIPLDVPDLVRFYEKLSRELLLRIKPKE